MNNEQRVDRLHKGERRGGTLKKLIYLLIAPVFVDGIACGAAYAHFIRLPLRQVDGELRVKGLNGPVPVARDRCGVPHICADQMELWPRVGHHPLYYSQATAKAETESILILIPD